MPGLHARDTRQVYDELVGSATRSLWISTYAYFDGPRAFETLADRMDAVAGLQVVLLLNIHRQHGRARVGRRPRGPLRRPPLEPRLARRAAARRLLRPAVA